jgi:protein-disulfide isomerase
MEKEAKIFSMPIAIVVGAIIIAAGLYFGLHSSSVTPTSPTTAAAGQQAAPSAVDVKDVSQNGEAFIGNPNAPVTIAYWYDYQCPFCKQDEQNVVPNVVSDYVNSGKVKIVFKDYPFLGNDSVTLAVAARAVWAVDQSKFYAWHQAMFNAQGQEGSGWASAKEINQVTTQVLGVTEATQVASLETSNLAQYTAAINADKTEANKFGVSATPSMLIGKQLIVGAEPYASVKSAIDTALTQ